MNRKSLETLDDLRQVLINDDTIPEFSATARILAGYEASRVPDVPHTPWERADGTRGTNHKENDK